jgi:hypothetical protein
MAACKLGNKTKARKLYEEFENVGAMKAICLGVVDGDTTSTPLPSKTPKCAEGEGDKLVAEAREAGSVNQWNKMMQKAEAAAQCGIGKTARQLQLMAACKMGIKDKSKRLYSEFKNVSAMQAICLGVVDE